MLSKRAGSRLMGLSSHQGIRPGTASATGAVVERKPVEQIDVYAVVLRYSATQKGLGGGL